MGIELENLFARALGYALAEIKDGLVVANFPRGLSVDFLDEIVRAANARRTDAKPNYALRVAREGFRAEPQSLVTSVDGAIGFRVGNRLAVTDLQIGEHSFTSSFSPIHDLGFPQKIGQDSVTLQGIAGHIVERLTDAVAQHTTAQESLRVAKTIAKCLEICAEAIRGTSSEKSETWNALWYRHAEKSVSNVAQLVQHLTSVNAASNLAILADSYIFTCFGLPKPNAGIDFSASRANDLANSFNDAVESYWFDEDAIGQSLAAIDALDDKQNPTTLRQLDFAGFNRRRIFDKNPILAWLNQLLPDLDVSEHEQWLNSLQVLNQLTEDNYFDPFGKKDIKVELLKITTTSDISAQISPANAKQNILAICEDKADGRQIFVSQPVKIYLKATGLIDASVASASKIDLLTNSKHAKFRGGLQLSKGVEPYFEGVFEVDMASKPKFKPAAPVKLSLELPTGDVLSGAIHSSLECEIVFIPASQGVLGFKRGAGDRLTNGKYYESNSNGEGEIIKVECSYPNNSTSVLLIAYGNTVTISGQNMIGHHSDEYVKIAVVPGTSSVEVLNEDYLYSFEPEASGRDIQSPIIAAIFKAPLTSKPAEEAALDSIRAEIETLFAKQLELNPKSFCHLITTSAMNQAIGQVEDQLIPGVLIDSNFAREFNGFSDFEVPATLRQSDEYFDFIDAIQKLDFLKHMVDRSPADSNEPDLASRTSWKFLWLDNKNLLETYLTSFARLNEKAKSLNDPHGIFWAAYPFSTSIWDPASGKCTAVMMSPMHPVRLTWLASVEASLFESQVSTLLAGTVEGWNFPFLGPDISAMGRMIAVPCDNGPSQVFLGWNLLLKASVSDHQALYAPSYIAGKMAPGAAASGMNSSAASASLRNYRRINPHLQSITVDLAAGSESQRLAEVDQTILEVTKAWAAEGSSKLPGGIKVLDSVNRLGNPPLGAITSIAIESEHRFPITWKRYNTDSKPASNIRLLQDSGLRVAVKPYGTSSLGVVGTAPLRRFDCTVTQATHNESKVSPTFSSDAGWYPFIAAVNALEAPENKPEIGAKLFNAGLVSSKADWTISGESLISPTGIADLLTGDAMESQMLWEWRPPIFDYKDTDSLLEKRPFISIARIPDSFKAQLVGLLSKAQGPNANIDDANQLLKELGSRGVGLSSLLSMGSTHAVGALGFFLTFRLMDLVPSQRCDVFVLPIDACNTFLGALVGTSDLGDSKKRADMLVVTVSDESVTLSPIEIKVYGLSADNPDPLFPGQGSSVIAEAKSQIDNTQKLLESIATKAAEVRHSGSESDRSVWFTALATLIESASRLSKAPTEDAEKFRDRLKAVANGNVTVTRGNGIISYFGYDATSPVGGLSTFEVLDEGLSLFSCNLAEAFRMINGDAHAQQSHQVWQSAAGVFLPADIDMSALSDPNEGSSQNNTTSAGILETDENPSNTFVEDDPISSNPTEVSTSTGDEHSEGLVETGTTPEPTPETSDSQEGRQASVLDYPESDGLRFNVGVQPGLKGPKNIDLWLGNTSLTHMNMGVVGNMGTGKTQLLKSIIYKITATAKKTQPNTLSFLVFDYKEDYQADEFVQKVGATVLLPYHIPVNYFELNQPYEPGLAYQKAQSFVSTLKKIYSGIGAVQENNLSGVIMDLYARPGNLAPTMREVRDSYTAAVPAADSVVSILNKFVFPEIFSENRQELRAFTDVLDGKVLIVALNKLGLDTSTKNALVVLFLDLYYEHMLKSTKWPFSSGSPSLRRLNSFLLVDEATNIMEYEFQILETLLLQGREYGFGIILASQYLTHFKAGKTNYKEALLTWFINKVPSLTKSELVATGIADVTDLVLDKIKNQEVHEGLYSSFGHKSIFILETPFYKLLD